MWLPTSAKQRKHDRRSVAWTRLSNIRNTLLKPLVPPGCAKYMLASWAGVTRAVRRSVGTCMATILRSGPDRLGSYVERSRAQRHQCLVYLFNIRVLYMYKWGTTEVLQVFCASPRQRLVPLDTPGRLVMVPYGGCLPSSPPDPGIMIGRWKGTTDNCFAALHFGIQPLAYTKMSMVTAA